MYRAGAAASTAIVVCSHIAFWTLVDDGLWQVQKAIWCHSMFLNFPLINFPLTDSLCISLS
ncbi:uncharacterized protein LACBIDRAFT_315871 [Laccaria bicolor S238N-H82]|uniref:Predicted protein n=1 Tax=Laccaria bicolor (strain S238N-H82 / ATCC MYA-4686) TaxID=486041 RepID=B0D3D4_LACBS|nr:uncharacterized protein LACBIDRAFT_315871 [Laccaria bicolor S238N-H82]EDR10898.1 predicted protein [Laccaria bicolor S238N-H82]|eukprot:XP_001878199.1 predicted protein [Laccaria bicolor S238N-H82]